MKLPTPTVWKTIFRADFQGEISYLTTGPQVASSITGYPNWEIDGAKITLYDWQKRRSAQMDIGYFAIEQDSGDLELETSSIDRLLEIVPDKLLVKNYVRLGYRRKYLFEVEMEFDSLVAIMNTKFLRQAELASVLPAISDSLFVFNSYISPYRYAITFAPVRKSEMLRALEHNRQYHLNPRAKAKDLEKLSESYPLVSMLADIDFFKVSENIPITEVVPFLLKAREEMKRITTSLSQYCFGPATD